VKQVGYTAISITKLAQEIVGEIDRSEAIKAYYLLMENEMIQKAVRIRNSGQEIIS